MWNFSLLHPTGFEQYVTLEENTINVLSLDFIIENMTNNADERKALRELMIQMPVSREVIEYRRSIYRDLQQSPELCETFSEICKEMEFYGLSGKIVHQQGSTLWDFLCRLKDLENYCGSIIKLKECLEKYSFKSDAMKQLKSYIDGIYQDSGFHELTADVEDMCKEIASIKSMTLGVNLDGNLYPVAAGIISLNEYTIEEQGVMKRYLSFMKRNHRKQGNYLAMLTHSTKIDNDEYQLRNNLTRLVERLTPRMLHSIRATLGKYVDISGMAFMQLADEFLFYKRFLELERKLRSIGMPCGMPGFRGNGSQDTELKDFYNLKLAICKYNGTIDRDIVCNDILWKQDEAILILTGPNRGGKTIFTQGMGLAFYLFQQGVFTTCSGGSMRICDNIFTHFPVDENQTISLGRLGEEAERFSAICKKATDRSLLLFNESFATTSHTESLYIARDALKYLCKLGAYTCFNTHMHELAEHPEVLSDFQGARTKAVSLVMETDAGERSYKIAYKKPDMTSRARDIAYQYGITFEQLVAENK